MSIDVIDKGKGNRLELYPWFSSHGRIRIEFLGNSVSVVIADRPLDCDRTYIRIGSGSSVEIGQGCVLSDTLIHGCADTHVAIGERTSFTARARAERTTMISNETMT